MSKYDMQLEYAEYLYNRIEEKLREYGDNELYVYAMLAIDLCLRSREGLGLTWNQIDFNNHKINEIQSTKGSIFDVGMPEDIEKLLRDYYNITYDNEKLFPNLQHMINVTDKIKELTGIFNFSVHELKNIGIQLKLKEINN